MKKNCRTCSHAEWSVAPSGRRRFFNYAACTFAIEVTLPLSRHAAARDLLSPVSVAEYKDVEIDCKAWAAIGSKPKNRTAYLIEVLDRFMNETCAGAQSIKYDDAVCDGRCLANDIAAELGVKIE